MSEMDILKNATQEQYNDFVKGWINIGRSGLRVDPSKTSNFFYDETIGFSFIDLNNREEIDITGNQETRKIFISELIAIIINSSLYYSMQMTESDRGVLEDKVIQVLPKLSQALQFNGIPHNEFNEILHEKYPKIADKYLTEKEKFYISLKKSNETSSPAKKVDEENTGIERVVVNPDELEW